MLIRFFVAVFALTITTLSGFSQFVLDSSGLYSQNFDSISSLPTGWDLRTGATTSTLGTAGATYTGTPTTATSWDNTTGAFKNMASATGFTGTEPVATQTAATNRALGVRQTSGFGDPGVAFTFRANLANVVSISSFNFDAMMLSVQPRSTTWTIRYSLGDTPTTFTNLGTFTDPGTFGSTSLTFASLSITPDASNEINFQIAALSATSGSGNRDSFGIDNFSIVYVPVPEPASIIGFSALGIAAVSWIRRRRS